MRVADDIIYSAMLLYNQLKPPGQHSATDPPAPLRLLQGEEHVYRPRKKSLNTIEAPNIEG